MANLLTMKLEQFIDFDPGERARLDELLSYPTETYERGKPIIREGAKVPNIYLVLTGLAARSKTLRNGERQIMALLVPGDLCDVEVFVLERMDHDIIALAETTCVLIPAEVLEGLLSEFSKLTKALWWSTMTDSAVLRQWIVGHGARDSREQIAHLMYEMLIRYRIIGQAANDTFPFLLTQEELGDATGITSVHVNRTLQQLRSEGLIDLRNRTLTVLDTDGLRKAAQYESAYLHLTRTERRDEEVSGRAGDLVDPSHRGAVRDTAEKISSLFGSGTS
ncbi:MAG TPA: Crp/Fnr family transcriptional regulator [Allosphingosinicella sp.]|nr:Crp/Fnr family transcriptional regulator [Allosphingosinicella sp.]